jgi:hypothetical protein
MPVVKEKYRGSREYALAYAALIQAAHSRGMATYAGIAHLTGLPTRGQAMASQVGHLVGEISEDEVGRGRPMLSALVVEKDTGRPGRGFYLLARNLGKLNGSSNTVEKKFLRKEKATLYEVWK